MGLDQLHGLGGELTFDRALQHLLHGDFSALEVAVPQFVAWYDEGLFADHPDALAEALSCACFNGNTAVAEQLLSRGVDPAAGARTGSDALHWAANRGQLETVRLLLRRGAPLETRNMYGGTVLDQTVWSIVNETRPAHLQIIEELLRAGARTDDVEVPTGNGDVDALLQRYRDRPSC